MLDGTPTPVPASSDPDGADLEKDPRFAFEHPREWYDKVAGVNFPEKVQQFEYNGKPLVGDVRTHTTLIDGVEIYTPDYYFSFNPDGSRPNDILFVYTPGEHVPDWDYSREALMEAATKNPGAPFVDGGCGTGVKANLMGKTLSERNLDNPILLVDPNQRAIDTTVANIKRNEISMDRYSTFHGFLHSALPQYQDREIAGAYINPPYQARPEHVEIALHCDGGHDGLKVTRELLVDLMPYLADNGVIAVHTKSPAYANKAGYETYPLILEDIVEGRIIPKEKLNEYEIRFSRACPPMDLYEFYRIVYREKENDFARKLADQYALIDMTLLLITRKKGQDELLVKEDPIPANPEGVEWGYKDGEMVEQGHILWHQLFVKKEGDEQGPVIEEDRYEYPPMDENRKWLLDYAVKMYLDQEKGFGETERKQIDLPGLPHFIVDKYVYDPGHVNIAMAWPEKIASMAKGKSFLDLGTGTGICGTYVALHGEPSQVTVTDISPMAVKNAAANAEQYNLKKPAFDVIESDVFSNLPADRKFDIMFWNFPWNATDQDIEQVLQDKGIEATPERVMQMHAGLDKQYSALRRFIKEGKDHLNTGGEILLGASELVRHDIIKGEAEKNGYNIEIAAEQEMVLSKSSDDKLKIILYKLTVKE